MTPTRSQLLLAAALAIPLLLAGCLGAADDLVDDEDLSVGTSDADVPETPDAPVDDLPSDRLPRANDTGLPVVDVEPVRVSGGAEPSLLADDDGEWVWLADTSGGYRTPDNGSTWERMPNPFLTTADGWSFAQDDAGDLYATTTNVPSVEVHRSTDDGASWTLNSRFADAAPIADRPWIAADEAGEVTLFFYDFGRTNSENCVRTTDGGLTWTDRRPLTGTPNAGGAAYDEEGNMYYVSDTGNLHRFGGTCLGGSETLQMFPDGRGSTGMLDVDAGGGAVYTAAPTSDNGDIVLSGTRDMEEARRIRVAPEAVASNTYPTVSALNDTVAVAWYGSQTAGDPDTADFDGDWHVYVALVDDVWSDDSQVRVAQLTSTVNHVGDICMGGIGCDGERDRDLLDYFRVEQDIWGGVHVAYGHDGDTDEPEVRYKHLPPSLLEDLPSLEKLDATGQAS